MRESQTTLTPRVISAIISGTGAVAFAALSVSASISGNGNSADSLLTPAFIGAIAAITLVYLISKE